MAINTKVKKNIGPSGLAEVRVGKNGLRVSLNDELYEVSSEGWNYPTGKYNVTLNQTFDRILFASPPGGASYLVTFKEFGNRQNKTEGDSGIPEPYIKRGGERTGKGGQKWFAKDELTVSCKLEVVDPKSPYKGLNIIYTFPYAFELDPSTRNTLITATASRLVRIEEFLRICGLDLLNDDMPYSSNVLPWLEERLQEAHKIFSVNLNAAGFVQSLTEIPDFLLDPALFNGNGKNGQKKTKKGTRVTA